MKEKRNFLLIIGGSILLLVAVILLSQLGKRLALKQYKEKEAKFKTKMAEGKFVPVIESSKAGGPLRDALANAISKNQVVLTDVQKQTLMDRTMALFAAYHMGTFEVFARFRYPPEINRPGVFSSNYISQLKPQAVQMAAATGNSTLLDTYGGGPDFPKASASDILNLSYQLWVASGSRWTNPVFCATCLDGADPEKIDVRLNTYTNRVGSIQEVLNSNSTLGFRKAPVNGIVHPTPKEIIMQKSPLTCAFVSVVIQTKDRKESIPVFVNFYWVEEYGDWLPYEFVNGFGLSELYFLMDL